MLLLRCTARECSADLLEQHCTEWTGFATTLLGRDSADTKQLCIATLRFTLRFGQSRADLRRELGANHLPTILNALVAVAKGFEAPRAAIDAFDTIAMCAAVYPGPTRPATERVLNAVASALDTAPLSVARAAACCYAALPLCSSPKAQASATGWLPACGAMVGSMHNTLALLFDGIEEESDWSKLQLPTFSKLAPAPEALADRVPMLVRRFELLAACTCDLLGTGGAPTSGAVEVPVEPMLALICRCLAVGWDSVRAVGPSSL